MAYWWCEEQNNWHVSGYTVKKSFSHFSLENHCGAKKFCMNVCSDLAPVMLNIFNVDLEIHL